MATLLIVGAREFLKASAAIASFGDAVFDAGLNVLNRRLSDLGKALRIPLDGKKIKEYPEHGYIGSGDDGTHTSVGPYISLPDWNYFHLYVWWRTGQDHRELCSAVASLGCKNRSLAEAVYRAVHKCSRGTAKKDDYEIYLEKPLKPEDFERLESHFELLIQQWTKYGETIGGLRKYLKC